MKKSPYAPARPSLFHISTNNINVGLIRLNPDRDIQEVMASIETVFRKYNQSALFQPGFVETEYNTKFGNEKRIGTLASFFSLLATLISCLGLFGLISFVAERRVKEIGIRKVLGASVSTIWKMLSREFVILVALACLVAFLSPGFTSITGYSRFNIEQVFRGGSLRCHALVPC